MTAKAFQDYYPDQWSHCYGCGRFNEQGLQIKSYWDGEETVCSYVPRPAHTAIPGQKTERWLRIHGAVFMLDDASVTLQWSAVGTLNDNEAYRVTVEDITGGEGRKLVDEVSGTSFAVPASFRAKSDQPHIYRWWVVPVRQIGTDESGNIIWDTAGAASETRVFTWVGETGEATPAP